MPGKMAYLRYTSDSGAFYSLKTRLRYLTALSSTGGGAALGFAAYTPGDPPLPRGMEPRGVYVQDPTGGATRFIPVGAATAPAWDDSVDTVQIDYSGIATLTDAVIIGRRGEQPADKPHVIVGRSDAN